MSGSTNENEWKSGSYNQLVLPLSQIPRLTGEDFFIGTANEMADSFIKSWPNWPSNIVLLTGPEGSGKSHLVSIWRDIAGAFVMSEEDLSDCDLVALARSKRPVVVELNSADGLELDQRSLFFFINAIKTYGNYAIITSRVPFSYPYFTVPDLVSRLRASVLLTLNKPDDDLLQAILSKLFRDYGITVSQQVLLYAIRHIERSYKAAISLAGTLNRISLITQSPVTRSMVRRVIDQEDGYFPGWDS